MHQKLKPIPNANTYGPAHTHAHDLLAMASCTQAIGSGDGHAFEKPPVMALEETRERKEVATNARGSTGTHHSKSMCAPSTKSIHHQGSEKMANLQRCKRITILGNLLAVNIAESSLASSRVEQVDVVLALGRQELPLAQVVH